MKTDNRYCAFSRTRGISLRKTKSIRVMIVITVKHYKVLNDISDHFHYRKFLSYFSKKQEKKYHQPTKDNEAKTI